MQPSDPIAHLATHHSATQRAISYLNDSISKLSSNPLMSNAINYNPATRPRRINATHFNPSPASNLIHQRKLKETYPHQAIYPAIHHFTNRLIRTSSIYQPTNPLTHPLTHQTTKKTHQPTNNTYHYLQNSTNKKNDQIL